MTRIGKDGGVAWIYLLAICLGVVVGRGMSWTPVTSETGRIALIVAAVLFCVLAIYVSLQYGLKALFILFFLALFGVIVEYVALQTCWPYGCFIYHDTIGPQFLGSFPYALFFIWPLIVVLIGQFIGRAKTFFNIQGKEIALAIVGGLFLVLFDLFLDPVAIQQGLWSYLRDGFWYGVPLRNFLGWFVTGGVSSYILLRGVSDIFSDNILRFFGVLLMSMYMSGFFFM